jgi:CTD small phosphatase-like protein 2
MIDPDRSLIQFRLYRQHCFQAPDGHYIKDLRVIRNRSLMDMLLVDNSVHSFGFQLDNGVPIIPFYDDHND